MIVPDSPSTAAGVAVHYDELDLAYRRIWGEHVHHGYWQTGYESPAEAAEALVAQVEARLAPEPGQTLLYAVYFAVPHLELFDVRDLIIHNWGTIPWLVWAGVIGYAVVYASLFLGAACLVFRRKAVN